MASQSTGNRTFNKQSRIDAPAEEVFAWHARPGALERLLPPWERMRIVRRRGGVADGGRVTLRMRMGVLPITWVAEHGDYVPGEQFADRQVKGPFKHFKHVHRVEPIDAESCTLHDEIEYRVPFGALGGLLGNGMVQRRLERTFDYRHALLSADIAQHQRAASGRTLTIAVTGSRGFVGRALVPFLTTGGHTVKRIVRGQAMHDAQIAWSPETGELEADKLEGVDAVVHLAGEPVVGRWNEAKKQRIRESRAGATRRLAEALAQLKQPPRVLVNASAIGFYGDRGNELLDEESEAGTGFLADVAQQWEQATQPAREAGMRVAMMRIGAVLDPSGGALGMMLPIFRLGLGGQLSHGGMWFSWITRNDLIGAIYHALCDERVSGPVNAVGPAPVTNRTFTKVLGRVLRRPTVCRVPRFGLRALYGEMADEAFLASARVQPKVLEATGYRFRDPELAPALSAMLGKG